MKRTTRWILILVVGLCQLNCAKQEDHTGMENDCLVAGNRDQQVEVRDIGDFYLSIADSLTPGELSKAARDISYGRSVQRGLDLNDDLEADIEFSSNAFFRLSHGPGISSGGTGLSTLSGDWELYATADADQAALLAFGDTILSDGSWKGSGLDLARVDYPGRGKDLDSCILLNCNMNEAYVGVREELDDGWRLYWICISTDTLGLAVHAFARALDVLPFPRAD